MKRRRQVGRQLKAVANPAPPVGIIGAAAGLDIEQSAGDVGEIDAAGVFVFEFDEASAATTVAEAFPLRRCQVFERLLPIGVRLRHPLAATLWFLGHVRTFVPEASEPARLREGPGRPFTRRESWP
jgi:hypothetical protein